jgi:hypothetical protein
MAHPAKIENIAVTKSEIDLANQELVNCIDNLRSNLGTRASNAKILSIVHGCSCPMKCVETVRFRRGCDIANHKNQIIILRKSQYSVKSQSNCGKYEVISTELGWIYSDRRFRNVICKHIFAIFSTLKRKLEAGSQNYEGYLIDFEVATSKPRDLTKEANQDQTQLTEEKEMNQNTLTQVADYEQELYEKDRYIEGLENKIRGLTGLTHYPREKII